MSAPVAVAVCGVFGIKKYLLAGLLASTAGLLLGTQTIFNVLIAMLFRIVVALLYAAFGKSRLFYLLSGPVASAAARLALGLIIGKAVYPLLAAALPGMAFTALTAGLGNMAIGTSLGLGLSSTTAAASAAAAAGGEVPAGVVRG